MTDAHSQYSHVMFQFLYYIQKMRAMLDYWVPISVHCSVWYLWLGIRFDIDIALIPLLSILWYIYGGDKKEKLRSSPLPSCFISCIFIAACSRQRRSMHDSWIPISLYCSIWFLGWELCSRVITTVKWHFHFFHFMFHFFSLQSFHIWPLGSHLSSLLPLILVT